MATAIMSLKEAKEGLAVATMLSYFFYSINYCVVGFVVPTPKKLLLVTRSACQLAIGAAHVVGDLQNPKER